MGIVMVLAARTWPTNRRTQGTTVAGAGTADVGSKLGAAEK